MKYKPQQPVRSISVEITVEITERTSRKARNKES